MAGPVLLVDSGFSATPLFSSLKLSEKVVGVVGNRPRDLLHQIADCSHHVDYSDAVQLSDTMNLGAYTAVVPGCTDASYIACSELLESRTLQGLDSIDTFRRLHDKLEFRTLCAQLGIPSPRTFSEEQSLPKDEPLIVKPTDAYSGRGVSFVNSSSPVELGAAVSEAQSSSRSGAVVIEQFVSGQLYSSSCFLQNGALVASFLVEEHCDPSMFSVSVSRVVGESQGRHRAAVEADLLKIASTLGLADGLLHLQWIDSGKRYWHIELTRRCPGDLYARLIELSTGFSYSRAYVSPFLGKGIESDESRLHHRSVLRVTLRGSPGELLHSIAFRQDHPLIEYHPLTRIGDAIEASGRLGVLFIDESGQTIAAESVFQGLLYEARSYEDNALHGEH